MNTNKSHTEQNTESGSVILKAIRAATTIIVFGIPLAIATGVMVGYGICKAYKKLKE